MRTLSPKAQELLADLPSFLAADPGVQGVFVAFANEAQRIDDAAHAVAGAIFPIQSRDITLLGRWAGRLLSMWETLLGLPVDPAGVSVADRQAKVVAHIRKRNAGAGSDWVEILSQAVGSVAWSYQEGPGDYQVTISIPHSSDYATGEITRIARAITPAHIDMGVGFGTGFIIGISEIGDIL